ncbi:antitoxin Xre/MbcA/ParS toxin-binding domain-containing protein [Sneathiella glossodoripedis]|uniref:antitoxin Xre/MbcA/ParS toxin-binding domain-containing protein n=1 Tax=Sneathiella glossodoripedis TaxID=418853 RepID=UPI00047122AC|nr:antitoxin Xre/MbcA/ParS toxin-binding domain-containing protein [Sneathiella glossodoripedis]
MSAQAFMNIENPYRSLGLRSKNPSPIDVVKAVESGFTLRNIKAIARYCLLEDNPKSIESFISRSTVDRLKRTPTKRVSKEISENLYAVWKVAVETRKIYGDDVEKSKRFLNKPHPMLDGKSPLQLAISSNAGADMVVDLLKRTQAGLSV